LYSAVNSSRTALLSSRLRSSDVICLLFEFLYVFAKDNNLFSSLALDNALVASQGFKIKFLSIFLP
jgi:hypothetical protein